MRRIFINEATGVIQLRNQLNGVALFTFVACLLAGVAASQVTRQPAYGIFGALVGVYFLFAIKIVRQWEKVAVLRLGRYV